MARGKSRAKRAQEQCDNWSKASDLLVEVLSEYGEEFGTLRMEEKTKMVEAANGAIGDVDTSIVEELKEEMESWRDSIPENLQGGNKYDEVSSACDALDAIDIGELADEISEPEEIQGRIEALETAVQELGDSVEFPGMF